jgi:hypothetical protein
MKQIKSWTITSTEVSIIAIILLHFKKNGMYGTSASTTVKRNWAVRRTPCRIMLRLLIEKFLLYKDSFFVVLKILQIAKIVTQVLETVIVIQNAYVNFYQLPEYHL